MLANIFKRYDYGDVAINKLKENGNLNVKVVRIYCKTKNKSFFFFTLLQPLQIFSSTSYRA